MTTIKLTEEGPEYEVLPNDAGQPSLTVEEPFDSAQAMLKGEKPLRAHVIARCKGRIVLVAANYDAALRQYIEVEDFDIALRGKWVDVHRATFSGNRIQERF